MTMDEFIALAVSNGWTLAPKDADQNVDEINLVDAKGRMIVAFPQPTIHGNHIGFIGSVYGLCEVLEEGTIDQKILEGQDLGAPAVGAVETLAYCVQEPNDTEEIPKTPTEVGVGEIWPVFTNIDHRWNLWKPSDAERAHFCATRETVEWLCSQRDGETDPRMAKAYDGLARKALEVHTEAAEPPLTKTESEMAWSVALWDADNTSARDLAEEWTVDQGRNGARWAIANFAGGLDETYRFTRGVTVSTHPVEILAGRTDHDCYPNFAFALKEPALAVWLDANRAALPEPPYVAPISMRECVEESELVCDSSIEVAPLVITMADALADDFRTRFPHLIATFVPFGGAAGAGGTDTALADDGTTLSDVKSG
jgi:hypothetical protein